MSSIHLHFSTRQNTEWPAAFILNLFLEQNEVDRSCLVCRHACNDETILKGTSGPLNPTIFVQLGTYLNVFNLSFYGVSQQFLLSFCSSEDVLIISFKPLFPD